jgi:intracellular sulfur oxidation DsrE/DsrF family protein
MKRLVMLPDRSRLALCALAVATAGCALPAGWVPAEIAVAFAGSARWRKKCAAIWLRPALWTQAKITVVTNGNGIEFLLEGAKDKNGNPYEIVVQDLKGKGVDFRVCNNTLVTRKIDPSKVIPEAIVVPSGVAEAAKLLENTFRLVNIGLVNEFAKLCIISGIRTHYLMQTARPR